MSELERDELREEPAEITTFVAEDARLIDPRWQESAPRPAVRRPRRWLPLFLFAATCVSTFLVGAFGMAILNERMLGALIRQRGLGPLLFDGLQYSAAVMSILLAHEMGHYLMARFHRVPASLPYFIPMPFSPLGTMGAVIVQGRGAADRRQMFDIAIAGPLAGLVLALPVMWIGIQQVTAENSPGVKPYVFGMPAVVTWMFDNARPELYEPAKLIAGDPLLMAGWVGIFVTALNLIPIGQLDGGHMLYCLIGRRAHTVALALMLLAVGWMTWTGNISYMLLVILLFLFGPRHPPTADDSVRLGWLRGVLGWLTLAFILIGFTLNPISN